MALATGSRVGPYQIVDALGAGGMGEVYRAKDTRLDRLIALKVLPASSSSTSHSRSPTDWTPRTATASCTGISSHMQALVLARAGQLRQSRMLAARAVSLAEQERRLEEAAINEGGGVGALLGDRAAARRLASEVLARSRGRDAQSAAALAPALSGEWPQSQSLAEDLAKRFPEDTSVQSSYLPTLERARIESAALRQR